jgi:hypothetical protein
MPDENIGKSVKAMLNKKKPWTKSYYDLTMGAQYTSPVNLWAGYIVYSSRIIVAHFLLCDRMVIVTGRADGVMTAVFCWLTCHYDIPSHALSRFALSTHIVGRVTHSLWFFCLTAHDDYYVTDLPWEFWTEEMEWRTGYFLLDWHISLKIGIHWQFWPIKVSRYRLRSYRSYSKCETGILKSTASRLRHRVTA